MLRYRLPARFESYYLPGRLSRRSAVSKGYIFSLCGLSELCGENLLKLCGEKKSF